LQNVKRQEVGPAVLLFRQVAVGRKPHERLIYRSLLSASRKLPPALLNPS